MNFRQLLDYLQANKQAWKIGICGAQGTGKTELADWLSTCLELPLIKEQARVAMKMVGIQSPRELKGNDELGRKYQQRCLDLQLINEGWYKQQGFVSDRTVIDNAMYWLKWHSGKASSAQNNDYYRLCELNATNYDLVIYIPPEIPLVDDGVRSPNKDYQIEMDYLIQILLKKMRPDNYIEVHGSITQRTEQVLRHLAAEIAEPIPIPTDRDLAITKEGL